MIFVPIPLTRILASAVAAAVAALSLAQAPISNTSLLRQYTLAEFGSGGGNDCWGYVSPSGRQYIIAGLTNKVAFIEVTNPAAPQYFASLPHTNSTWCDIKTYGQYAYSVTEAVGTGIQVINLTNIDNHIVTLTTTITNPGRTHTLALDEVSGFLYTCGSRDSLGTTMCFSLANPALPVKVGANTMTGTQYIHAAQAVTYTSGPYAGKQIFFGYAAQQGFDIYDVTNKNAPVLLKRLVYPSVGYCHQGWLSADRKYVYCDDEFDENQLGVVTRSLIFNVEDLANPTYVGTFTSGSTSIDHNQFATDGFIFQANYNSGLRIFDSSSSQTAPVQTGWYDTRPTTESANYEGAWSNYPFLPNGIVAVSDINGGLFLIDVTEATTRNVPPTEVSVQAGKSGSNGLTELAESDDNKLVIHSMPFTKGHDLIALSFAATAYDTSPVKIRVDVESSAQDRGLEQIVELKNWVTGAWEQVDRSVVQGTDTTLTITPTGSITRFVNQTTRRVEGRLSYGFRTGRSNSTIVSIDMARFRITR